jgi:DNA-binding MarR family transcriptional regulator
MSDGERLPLERIIHVAEFRARLRRFMRQTERTARNWGLTPQRYLLLLAIKGAPDGTERLNFTELADRLQLSQNTVTELCARAEQVGLISREPSPDDQRVVFLRVTREGERRLNGALLENDEYRRELMEVFDELAQTFRLAHRV